jgi:hypothetical protein
MTRIHSWAALALLAMAPGLAGAAERDGKFDFFLKYVPEGANALVACDVQGLFKSPLAQKEGWLSNPAAVSLPPMVTQGVLAAKFDPAAPKALVWEVGAMGLKQHATFEKIAEHENGVVDTVANQPVVLSSRDAYFVRLGSGILGMQRPANRQDVAHWLRFVSGNRKSQLSEFLADAVAKLPADDQFLLALDLQDVISPAAIRARLATSKALGDKKVDIEALAKLLGGLKGLKVSVRVADDIRGELTLQFADNAESLKDVALPLVAAALAHRGASIADILDWKTDVSGEVLTLRGPLSGEGFRELLSFVQPLPPPSVPEQAADPKLSADLKRIATQQYLKSIATILDDLKRTAKRAKQDTDVALWYEKFAEKVQGLATGNVDEEAAAFGRFVVSSLEAYAASLHGQVVQINQLAKDSTYYASVGWNWTARTIAMYEASQHWAKISAEQTKVAAEGAETREKIWQALEGASTSIRQKMREKYNAEF